VTKPEPRTVIVKSPSALRETGSVVRAVVHITVWSALLMGASWFPGRGTSGAAKPVATAVDEIAFRELDADAQRLYRASLEGLTEAEDVRSRSGEWPAVEVLAGRKIPPFAPDPLDRASYRWKLLRDGTLVNYVGTPAGSGANDPATKRPTFVISILEPDPGTPIDPQTPVDETHHKLRDGTILHVSVWTGPKQLDKPAATPAFEDGWRRITMAAP
jgi:hypothetical protein